MDETAIGVAGHMRVAVFPAASQWGGKIASLMKGTEGCLSWDRSRRVPVKATVKRFTVGEAPEILVVHSNYALPLYVTPETEFYLPDSGVWTPASMLQPQMRLQPLTVAHAKALGLSRHWQGLRRSEDIFVLGVELLWSRKRKNLRVRSSIRREFKVYSFAPEPGTGFFINSILVRTHRL